MNIEEEVYVSKKEQVEIPPSMEMTHILNKSVHDISNKSKSNIMFYTADGCIPGQIPTKKPDKPSTKLPFYAVYIKPNVSCTPHQSITCLPRKKQVEETPKVQSCEACGTKKKRYVSRATSVSPERIFHCPDKKRIREHYEKEIKSYKQKMRTLNQKVRRLEESKKKMSANKIK